LIGSPDYSASEGDAISGNLTVTNMRSCWYGEFGDIVLGNVYVAHNTFADLDATEIGGNEVFGNLACFHNVPDAQVGDAGPAPNTVLGTAQGECKALSIPYPLSRSFWGALWASQAPSIGSVLIVTSIPSRLSEVVSVRAIAGRGR
jgi:hypothetical protein